MSMFANPGSKSLLISFNVKAKLALAIDYKGRLVSCPIAPSLHPNSLISHVFDVCLKMSTINLHNHLLFVPRLDNFRRLTSHSFFFYY